MVLDFLLFFVEYILFLSIKLIVWILIFRNRIVPLWNIVSGILGAPFAPTPLFPALPLIAFNLFKYITFHRIVEMELYGRNDIALGSFLERYCFRFDCTSASCDVPMAAHTRRFVHNQGVLNIKLRNLENPLPTGRILMWTWCPKCAVVRWWVYIILG